MPPTLGTPGRTVSGKEIPAKPGKDREFRPGENVRVGSDDTLYAAVAGVVHFTKRRMRLFTGARAVRNIVSVVSRPRET